MKLLMLLFLVSMSYAQKQADDMENEDEVESSDDFLMGNFGNQYEPKFESLSKHPIPEWFHAAKVGVMIHWGVYSIPAMYDEWFWYRWQSGSAPSLSSYMQRFYRPGFTYQDFGPMFTAEFFNANEWAKLFKRAGAKYVVLTTKHHDGYALFPSQRSFSWNSVDVGPHIDITKEIAEAVRNHSMEFGAYYSLMEWFHPLYNEDFKSYFRTDKYPIQKLIPDLVQIVKAYKPSIIWADGEWEAPATYWKSEKFIAWLFNTSPMKDYVVVNDRWGRNSRKINGDFFSIEYTSEGILKVKQNHKFEIAVPLDRKSWGFRKNTALNDLVTIDELLHILITTVSCGGNVLINVGATKEGTIPLIFQETLQGLGDFLDVNGEAIYNTSCWKHQVDVLNPNVWYTCRSKGKYNPATALEIPRADMVTAIYALFLRWPMSNILKLRSILGELSGGDYQVNLIGYSEVLRWEIKKNTVNIKLPDRATVLQKGTAAAWALKVSVISNNTSTDASTAAPLPTSPQ